MASSQLYPEIRDISSVGPRYSTSLYLPVGVEGQMDNAGTATVAQAYLINTPADADTYFGPASPLGALVKFLLSRGVSQIIAIPSAKGSAPTTLQRQTAWAVLESNQAIRLRMTDSTAQADLVALAVSCNNAELLYNKQIAFGGLAAGTTKAAMLTASTAIASKRFCLVGPGVYDNNGSLLSGNMAAAAVCAEVSRNPDISDDLDLMSLVNLTGIELTATGQPLFNKRVVAGSAVNDFEDLLQGGVSPLQANPLGTGVQLTHLRTTWTTDATYDAVLTRLIVDQIFIDVRSYLLSNNFLRRGNTAQTRADVQAGVEALLNERNDWILPVITPSGLPGYKVAVTSSPDGHQLLVGYEGIVIRNVQTIVIDAKLSIPV